jgi:hypothetical protein
VIQTQIDALLHDHRARTEIYDCLMRYCRGVDRLDRELILSAYHPGARDNHGSFDGPVEEFVDWVFGNHQGKVLSSVHHIGNVLMRIEGNVAHCESYVLTNHRRMIEGQLHDMLAHGRFIDRFEDRGTGWLTAERIVVFDWDRLEPVERQWGGPLTEQLLKAERSRSDPSYQTLDAMPRKTIT